MVGRSDRQKHRQSPKELRTIIGMDPIDTISSDDNSNIHPRTLVEEMTETRSDTPLEHLFRQLKMVVWGQMLSEDPESALPSSDNPEVDAANNKVLPRRSLVNEYPVYRNRDNKRSEVKAKDIELPYGQGHLILFREERTESKVREGRLEDVVKYSETLALVPQGVFRDDKSIFAASADKTANSSNQNAVGQKRRMGFVAPVDTIQAVLDSIESDKGSSWLPEIFDDSDNAPHISSTRLCSYFTIAWTAGKDYDVQDEKYASSGLRKLLGPSHVFGLSEKFVKELDDAPVAMQPESPQTQKPTLAVIPSLEDTIGPSAGRVNLDSTAVMMMVEEAGGLVPAAANVKETVNPCPWLGYESIARDHSLAEDVHFFLDDALKEINARSISLLINGLLVLYDTGSKLYALHLEKDGVTRVASNPAGLPLAEERIAAYGEHLYIMDLDRERIDYALQSFFALHDGEIVAISGADESVLGLAVEKIAEQRVKTQPGRNILEENIISLDEGGEVFFVGQWAKRSLDTYVHDHAEEFFKE